MDNYRPLNREEVRRAVERQGGVSRLPLCRAKWWGEGLTDQYGDQLNQFDNIPEDVIQVFVPNPVWPERMNLSWKWKQDGAHDARIVLDDWAKLDEFIEKLPDPHTMAEYAEAAAKIKEAKKQDRYVQLGWWNFFFEKPWGLRGMENLLCDFYVEPENLKRLYEAMCDQYCRTIDAICELCKPDGFWTSDDLGHQAGPMMGPDVFHEQIFPFYKRFASKLYEHNMHFWLHSCGNNTELLDDLIEAGVDVFHPVQKHTMDEEKTVERFGDRITFLAGIDVQHTLQEKDPAGVREEVRFLIDTFDQPDGGLCIAAGNGIVSGTPIENIEAFLEEALEYGQRHRARFS
ncbi:MAG: uroporphyrinogen decarboxylase family protein [Lentisphaeria bacterium]